MNTRSIAILSFTVLSLLLWGLTAYLAIGADGSQTPRVYVMAAGFTALVMSAHTLLYLMFGERKARERAWLLAHGTPIEAEIVKISRYGDTSAWRIKARHVNPKTGKEQTFKSHTLRANPGRHFQPGDTIRIYLHPRNPRRYWMETGIDARNL